MEKNMLDLDPYEFRIALDYFLNEHSISELLEMVMFAVQRKEEALIAEQQLYQKLFVNKGKETE